MQGHGLDAKELQPGGQTLLHNLVTRTWSPRVAFLDEVEFFEFLLGLGLEINARDDKGQTMLHIAAERENHDSAAANFELLIAHGADKSIKDASGKRAFDLAARSLKKVREVLK